jgi:hypothetical protein
LVSPLLEPHGVRARRDELRYRQLFFLISQLCSQIFTSHDIVVTIHASAYPTPIFLDEFMAANVWSAIPHIRNASKVIHHLPSPGAHLSENRQRHIGPAQAQTNHVAQHRSFPRSGT